MLRMLTALAVLLGIPALLLTAAPVAVAPKEGDGEAAAVAGTCALSYKFEYQSYTEKDARIYRVRNAAGALLTTVNWQAGSETLLELGIPRCSNTKGPCDWITTRHPYRAWKVGETMLAYGGPNKDEQKEKPRGVKEDSDGKGTDTTNRPLTTTLQGEIASAEPDTPSIRVDLTVTSLVSKESPYVFVYKVERGKVDDIKDFTFSKEAETKKKGIQVVWHPLAARFLSSLRYSQKYDKDPVKDAELPAHVGRDRGTLTIEAKATGDMGTEVGQGLLEILQDGKRVAATSAPAYRPKE
jgi:hypothetical protein